MAGENVGTYDIEQGTLALSSNYNLTFIKGTFTISVRDITVTADDQGKTYGDADPALTYQITSGSLVGSDSFTGAISRVAGESVGTYDIEQGTLALSSNYNLTFIKGTFTISVRDITVTADDQGKTYGDADPALTYQITSGSLVGSDSFTGAISRVAGENVGTYDIEQGTLALSSNYNLTFIKGTFTISVKDITVTADDQGKTYGDADPALTYQITSGSLVGSDSFTGAISRVAGESVGAYDIEQGTLALSSNYNLTFIKGTFTISVRDITVTADDQGKTYGDADPALTYQITSGSLVGGDNFTGAISRVAGESVGTYDIEQGTLALSSNYNLTFIKGTLTVNKGTISLEVTSSTPSSKSGHSVTLTVTITGTGATGTVTIKDGETILGTSTLSNGTATYTTSTLSVGSHSITAIYSGDASFQGSTSPAIDLTVRRGAGGSWGLIGGIITALLLLGLLFLLLFWRRRKSKEKKQSQPTVAQGS